MRFEDIEFLTLDNVIELHAEGLARYTPGSPPGVKDRGGLESAVMAPQTGYYDTLAELGAVYAHGIGAAHYFHDGNKRAGVTAAITFLEMNGRRVQPGITEHMMVDLVTGAMTRAQFAAELARAIGGDEPIEP